MERLVRFSDVPIDPIDFEAIKQRIADEEFAKERERIAGEYRDGLITEDTAIKQLEDLSLKNKPSHQTDASCVFFSLRVLV
ncbi:MAG: hypothetical protein ACREBW_04415, partial [Candidatus Micrarchaeaceae archaeon]